MAATLRCRFCSAVQFLHKNNTRSYQKTYYVLLPEVPPDTPQTNPVMQIHGPPKFTKINPDRIITGAAKRAINYEVELEKHSEKLKDPNLPKNFENVFVPIEELTAPMMFAFNITRVFYRVNTRTKYIQACGRAASQIEVAQHEPCISDPLYNAMQELKADRSNLTDFQERVVDKYLLQSRVSGVELSGGDRQSHVVLSARIKENVNHFRNRLNLSHNMFSHTMTDFGQVVDFPKSLVAQMAVDRQRPSHGPWRVTLNDNIYLPFMEYCSHRMMRWNVWQAHRRRSCQDFTSQNLHNHNIIEDIRLHRRQLAELLGYENYAEMSMETKMAGSVDNVINLIENLKSKFYPKLVEDLEHLQDFANSEGFRANIEMWDLAFWRRRHKEHLFNVVETQDLMPYFPYDKVLEGLFHWCKLLFGVEFKNSTSSVETWHSDVSCFSVIDVGSGDELGSVYIDPYHRPPTKSFGFFTEPIRDRSDVCGMGPLSYIHLGLTPPYSTSRSTLLTVSEAHNLFQQFGNALQQVLTVVPYCEIAGQQNLETDTKNTCSMVMGKLFYNPAVLRSVTQHHETGAAMPDTTINTVINMSKYLSSYDIVYDLYTSAFDMEMYISDEFWRDSMKKLWSEYLPLTLVREDEHPCSLYSIFCGYYPAAFYSFIWSEMLASDVVSTFEQSGFDNPEKLSVVGRRFRDTFFSLGGGVSGNEVFRRFQGRDPSIDPYLKYYTTTH